MKKKRTNATPRVGDLWKKRVLIMKLLSIMLLTTYLSVHANMYSQQTVNVDMKNISLDMVFKELGKQTKRDFLFSHSMVKTKGKIDLKAENRGLEEVLDEILPALGLEYVLDENVVIIRERQTFQQQDIQVTGKVTDEKNQPLPGVTIVIKGTTQGTTTNRQGIYSLTLPRMEGVTLVFSFVGMATREVKYDGKEVIDVVMKETVSQLDEVIVSTGYQNIDLRTTTSAIQSIKAEDIVIPGLTSIDQMLEGHVPGMVFMQNSGQLGAAPRLRIRGTSTVLASQEPLWVVDGIVQQNPVNVDPSQINDLDFVNLLGNAISGINPEDIAQIDVLKDASATALYGARAANGVIVITTKQGKSGPPTLSYALSGTFTRRPYYTDSDVNMMNSRERVAFSREVMEKRLTYPAINAWVGYEKIMRDYWQGLISFESMRKEVNYYENLNTDWFDHLMQNTFSHKHTLSLSGGSQAVRYYISAGVSDNRGSIRGEEMKQYTTSINLSANFNRWNIRFSMNGNVDRKKYTPSDVEVNRYAYETSRALPAYNEKGELWFYDKMISQIVFGQYNIIHEKNNSSQDIRSSGVTATANINYKISEALKASMTASYSTNNTTQEIWHGANTFYAEKLRKDGTYGDRNWMPQGGELKYENTERYAYTGRVQIDFNKFIDAENKHLITASAGTEVSSNQYYGMSKTFRGYLKERGKKMAEINLSELTTDAAGQPTLLYLDYATWLGSDPQALGVWTDRITNLLSGYATVSYTYNNLYAINANVRMDASNRFGTRANEKLSPIWSFSGRWDAKNDVLQDVNWIDILSLRGSFGYQGNMLEAISSNLIIQRGGIDAYLQDYESTVSSYPNPDLKWEKTASYNISLDFNFFRNKISGSFSYFYKKTKDVFLQKSVSSVNGVSNWTVNQGTLENQGIELGLQTTVLGTRSGKGFYWSINPNFGQMLNQLVGNKNNQNKLNADAINYNGLLNGSYQVDGEALNSFYSYQFQGLNINNGAPTFYGSARDQYIPAEKKTVDLQERYGQMKASEIFLDMLEYSGTRVPVIQGGVQNSFGWKQFSMSANVTYSFGSKVRLLKMYSNIATNAGSIAPQPEANVRKEFLNRWRKPGDEFYTNIPGMLPSTDFTETMNNQMWWRRNTLLSSDGENINLADNLWTMYDNSNLRVVSGDFVKIQSLTLRYNLTGDFCKKLSIRSGYVGLSGTNLYTFCNKRLKGQDPATQSGSAPTINMSLRPTYSFNLNISF